MIGINVSKQRFSLYDLDEGEMFIKDYVSTVTYYVPNIKKSRNNFRYIIFGK